jgi:large subunit ribosomal protein L18
MQSSNKRKIRHNRVRSVVFGTPERPRLAVFRSNRAIVAQLIDDSGKGGSRTLAHVVSYKMKGKAMDKAKEVGKMIAEKAAQLKIKKVVFDRGGYSYAGKVRALAESARANGLEF